jgi:MFS family permease
MDATVRRTLIALAASFTLSFAAGSMVAGPGSAALVDLSGRAQFAGLYVALFNLGAAAGAAIGGRAMDRWGRRIVLMIGYALGAVGCTIAGSAVAFRMLAPFVAGVLMFAGAAGISGLTRVAAAEIFPPSERGRGIAWVQTSAIAGAIGGPLLLVLSEPLGRLLGPDPLTIVWFLAPPLLITASLALRRATEPMTIAREIERSHPRGGLAQQPGAPDARLLLVAGVIALAASQAAMSAVMGIAGAAVVHAGHGAPVLGTVMMLHFVGMFGLSRVVGQVTDRFGRRNTILAGLLVQVIAGLAVAAVPGMPGFGAGILLAGLGWSFAYIGATVLLTNLTEPERRARVLGRADLVSSLTAAVVATSGGFWFAANGLAGLGLLAIAVVTIPLVLFLLVAEPGAPPVLDAARE